MKNLLTISCFILVAICFTAHANPGSWIPEKRKILEVIVEGGEGGEAIIYFEGGLPAAYIPSSCSASPNNTVYLNNDRGRSIYSLVLAAYLAGKPVTIALSCNGSIPVINHIRF